MSVGELATRLAINEGEVIKTLFKRGLMVQVNQVMNKLSNFQPCSTLIIPCHQVLGHPSVT